MKNFVLKKTKLVLLLFYTIYMLFAPFNFDLVHAETKNKGDIYGADGTFGDRSVKVNSKNGGDEGNISVTKTVSKTDTLGKYNVSFDIESKKVTEWVKLPSYTIFVVDTSTSMSTDGAFEEAKRLVIDATNNIISKNDKAKVALVTFNLNSYISRGFSHDALTDEDFGTTLFGSNYDAGLMRTLELLNNTNFESDAIKNIVFLSNGKPNSGLAYLDGVNDVNTYRDGTRRKTTYSSSNIDGYYFVPDKFSYLEGDVSDYNFMGFEKDRNGDFTSASHIYPYNGTYTRNDTLKKISDKLTNENESIYSVGFNIDTPNSQEEEILSNIATDNSLFSDKQSLGNILSSLADKKIEKLAGTNVTIIDNLGEKFSYNGEKSFTKYIGDIKEVNDKISFDVWIDQSASEGLYNVNDNLTLLYNDATGINKTLTLNESPKVYWTEPTYKINYFYEGFDNPFKIETVKAKWKDVIDASKIMDKISLNAPKGYVYKSINPNDIIIESDDKANIINVYYAKIPAKIKTNTITKTGTNKILHTNDEVTYQITYNAVIDDFKGDAQIKITDTLPFSINTLQTDINSSLDGGIYNASNNTITWNITKEDIDTFTSGVKDITVTKTYKLVYSGINPFISSEVNNSFENSAEAVLTLDGSDNKTSTAKHKTYVSVLGKVISNYLLDGSDIKLIESKTSTGLAGSDYDIKAEEIYGYTLKENPNISSGKFKESDTIIDFYYIKNPGIITSKIEKVSDEELDNITNSVNYKLTYNASINDYIGDATFTFKDNLPYKIDEEKSNLDEGVYDEENKTITWTYEKKNINKDDKDIEFTKDIDLFYLDIDGDITNKFTAQANFGEEENTIDAVANTKVKKSTILVRYVDVDGKEIAPSTSLDGYVGSKYKTNQKDIGSYFLTKIIGNKEGVFLSDDYEVTYVYDIKRVHSGLLPPQTGIKDLNYLKVKMIIIPLMVLILEIRTLKRS